jgi:tetratricopeptide (TPR) repeat protein
VASVFLSYDREDADYARPIAVALEKAGHSVWWDLHVRSGAQFGKVIEEALTAAQAVVVLWSKQAVESAWVRDEASAGRDTGRLVPVTIDGSQPPLGFRQFQTIDLSHWKGRRKSAQWQKLLDDIAELAAGPKTPLTTPAQGDAAVAREPRKSFAVNRAVLAGIALLLMIAAAVITWRLIGHSPTVPLVAVASADSSSTSQGLARDLLVKLGSLQAGNPHSIDLVSSPPSGRRPTLLIQVSGTSSGQMADANLALMNPKDSSLIWAKDFPQNKAADLKQQLAYTGAQVLRCALEGLDPAAGGLSRQALKTYLTACASMADPAANDPMTSIRALQGLVRQRPQFRGAWAKLLLAEIYAVTDLPEVEASPVRAALAQHIIGARKANPEQPEAYIAEFVLTPDGQFVERSRILEQGIERNPDTAELRNMRSVFLESVGSMDDAVQEAQRAVELDPLSPTLRDEYISVLAFAGRFDEALAQLRQAVRLWPGATSLAQARYLLHLRTGDPREALRLLHAGVLRNTSTSWIQLHETFLQARLDPSPEKTEKAIRVAKTVYNQVPYAIGALAQTLAEFDRQDELISLLLNSPRMHRVSELTEVMFRPAFKDLHADPRFIRIAQHLGLLNYWRTTGRWPDFCFRADLKYDCKKEADRLAAGSP